MYLLRSARRQPPKPYDASGSRSARHNVTGPWRPDAGEFLAYRDGAKHEPSRGEGARKDSVSGMSIRERIQKAFGRGG